MKNLKNLKNIVSGTKRLASRILGLSDPYTKTDKPERSKAEVKKLTIWSRNLSGSERRRLMRKREKIIAVGKRPEFSAEDRAERKFKEAKLTQLSKWHRRMTIATIALAARGKKAVDREIAGKFNSAAARASRLADLIAVEVFTRQYRPTGVLANK